MRLTGTFHKIKDAYLRHPRYIDSGGGTRSGKTFSTLQLLYLLAIADKTPTLTSVVSETLPHLKRGAIRDFKAILAEDNLWDENAWSKTDFIYQLPNGSAIEFFSAENPGKIHGAARDRLFVNEAVNIEWETFRQLDIRTRDFIICDYNPTHAFWMHQQIANRDNCVSIISTYLDNPFLTKEQVEAIEANKKDANWWRVYGQGLVGQMDGLIYSFEQIDALPDNGIEVIGVDFGFTNDPTAIIRCKVDTGRKIIYADEIAYRTRMLNADIAKVLSPFKGIEVYADCAEPKSIAEIQRAGINIRPSDKTAPTRDRLTFQIQWMQGWQLMVTKQSVNLIKELRNYTWAKDSSGNTMNKPIDIYNHAMDALRYCMFTKFATRANQGAYKISVL